MNDDARENGSVTGKALGNIALAGGAILAGGVGLHLTAKTIGKVSDGVKKGVTKAKDIAGKAVDKYANFIDPLKNDIDAKYVRNVVTGDPKKILNKDVNKQAKEYATHLKASDIENKANMSAMDDLTSLLSPDGGVSAIQTSMLEGKSDGSIGRVTDELKLDRTNGAGPSKKVVKEAPVSDNTPGQFSIFDDGYVSDIKESDNYIATKRNRASKEAEAERIRKKSEEAVNKARANKKRKESAFNDVTFLDDTPISSSGKVQSVSPEQMNSMLGSYSVVNNHQQTNFGPTIENAKNLPPVNGPTIKNASGLPVNQNNQIYTNGGGSNMNQQFINISSSQGQPRTSSPNSRKRKFTGMNVDYKPQVKEVVEGVSNIINEIRSQRTYPRI